MFMIRLAAEALAITEPEHEFVVTSKLNSIISSFREFSNGNNSAPTILSNQKLITEHVHALIEEELMTDLSESWSHSRQNDDDDDLRRENNFLFSGTKYLIKTSMDANDNTESSGNHNSILYDLLSGRENFQSVYKRSRLVSETCSSGKDPDTAKSKNSKNRRKSQKPIKNTSNDCQSYVSVNVCEMPAPSFVSVGLCNVTVPSTTEILFTSSPIPTLRSHGSQYATRVRTRKDKILDEPLDLSASSSSKSEEEIGVFYERKRRKSIAGELRHTCDFLQKSYPVVTARHNSVTIPVRPGIQKRVGSKRQALFHKPTSDTSSHEFLSQLDKTDESKTKSLLNLIFSPIYMTAALSAAAVALCTTSILSFGDKAANTLQLERPNVETIKLIPNIHPMTPKNDIRNAEHSSLQTLCSETQRKCTSLPLFYNGSLKLHLSSTIHSQLQNPVSAETDRQYFSTYGLTNQTSSNESPQINDYNVTLFIQDALKKCNPLEHLLKILTLIKNPELIMSKLADEVKLPGGTHDILLNSLFERLVSFSYEERCDLLLKSWHRVLILYLSEELSSEFTFNCLSAINSRSMMKSHQKRDEQEENLFAFLQFVLTCKSLDFTKVIYTLLQMEILCLGDQPEVALSTYLTQLAHILSGKDDVMTPYTAEKTLPRTADQSMLFRLAISQLYAFTKTDVEQLFSHNLDNSIDLVLQRLTNA